jgi:hypothetical protein
MFVGSKNNCYMMSFRQELEIAQQEGFEQGRQRELRHLTKIFEELKLPTKDHLLAQARSGATRLTFCLYTCYDPKYLETSDVVACFKAVHGEKLYGDLPFHFAFNTDSDEFRVYVSW